MKELVLEKINLLIDDLKKNKEIEQKTGKSMFNTDLFAIRVEEIKKILKGEE